MERQAVTVRIPAELLEQAKQLRENRESLNEMVIEAIDREVRRRKALAAHHRIVARSAAVEAATGIQASSVDLIHQLREGAQKRD